MSFYQNPNVDSSSERSEDSVLQTKNWFKRTNGFMSREEAPDYGVDLDVELITNSGTGGFKFAIQIKSCAQVKKIRKKDFDFISLSFLTSRLGYLMRRIPGYGIIVIYDDKTEICYFDYAEEIINRLTQQRQSEDWKKQKAVKINIPFNSTITNLSFGS